MPTVVLSAAAVPLIHKVKASVATASYRPMARGHTVHAKNTPDISPQQGRAGPTRITSTVNAHAVVNTILLRHSVNDTAQKWRQLDRRSFAPRSTKSKIRPALL